MSQAYHTISTPTHGLFKDRGSKFIAHAYPISEKEDVKPLLDQLRIDHPSSRHVCYAYQLGADAQDFRANDDGEPNGTAGLPILNQIKSKGVTNTLVAVVRYIGGTKLGVSGLINAYKEAAKEALNEAVVIEKIPTSKLRLEFPHSSIGDVERTIRQMSYAIIDQKFEANCSWLIEVPFEKEHAAVQAFSAYPAVKIQ